MYYSQFLTEVDLIVTLQDSYVTAETRMLFDSLKGKAEYFLRTIQKDTFSFGSAPIQRNHNNSISLIYG